jgi:hypothetical protein
MKKNYLFARRATFAASKFLCLLIDGNADSRSTSAVFQTVTLFYTVCKIFLSKSVVFEQIKLFFLLRERYLAAILMVSLCDTHWGNFNKFSKFVKIASVQRVKLFERQCMKTNNNKNNNSIKQMQA